MEDPDTCGLACPQLYNRGEPKVQTPRIMRDFPRRYGKGRTSGGISWVNRDTYDGRISRYNLKLLLACTCRHTASSVFDFCWKVNETLTSVCGNGLTHTTPLWHYTLYIWTNIYMIKSRACRRDNRAENVPIYPRRPILAQDPCQPCPTRVHWSG